MLLGGQALLLWLALPLVWRYFRRRAGRDPRYGDHMAERRGLGRPFPADVWLHAVSIGETISAEPLIRLLLGAGCRIVTTHATPAGRARAEASFAAEIGAGRMAVRYVPVDLPCYWRRFLAATAPRVGLVMEMEFWPVMIDEARRAGVALCLANAQVPSKSFPRARRLARLAGHPAARAAAVFAKSGRMAERFRALGATRVAAFGETRFDIAAPASHLAAGRALGAALGGRRVLTLASVVAGEEEIYVAALAPFLAGADAPLVIWVPRAPELFEATVARLAAAGYRTLRRSEAFDAALAPRASLDGVQILVGNSLGEMFFYLAPADAVIVGGGFVEKGAHNVIEALSLGKPVITGPAVWTIEFPAVEASAAGVLTICAGPGDLAGAVRRAMAGGGAAARAFHAAHAGASARIFAAIRPILERAE